jgi:hypothetical protein
MEVLPCAPTDSYQSSKNSFCLSVRLEILVTANALPSSLIPSTLKMALTRPSETSNLTRASWRHIPEDDTLSAFLFTQAVASAF